MFVHEAIMRSEQLARYTRICFLGFKIRLRNYNKPTYRVQVHVHDDLENSDEIHASGRRLCYAAVT